MPWYSLALVFAFACGGSSSTTTQTIRTQDDSPGDGQFDAGQTPAPPDDDGPDDDGPDDDGPDDDGVDGGQATIPSYERCSDLGDRARRNFEASLATVDVPQCEVETHCQAEAFYSDRDGCWASCTVLAGSEAYSEELKTLARASCSRFFAAGCEVASAGCPAPSSDVAPLGCQDSVCATQE
jgi:hypothetical protein